MPINAFALFLLVSLLFWGPSFATEAGSSFPEVSLEEVDNLYSEEMAAEFERLLNDESYRQLYEDTVLLSPEGEGDTREGSGTGASADGTQDDEAGNPWEEAFNNYVMTTLDFTGIFAIACFPDAVGAMQQILSKLNLLHIAIRATPLFVFKLNRDISYYERNIAKLERNITTISNHLQYLEAHRMELEEMHGTDRYLQEYEKWQEKLMEQQQKLMTYQFKVMGLRLVVDNVERLRDHDIPNAIAFLERLMDECESASREAEEEALAMETMDMMDTTVPME